MQSCTYTSVNLQKRREDAMLISQKGTGPFFMFASQCTGTFLLLISTSFSKLLCLFKIYLCFATFAVCSYLKVVQKGHTLTVC